MGKQGEINDASFVYVSACFLGDDTGQSVFEKELIGALLSHDPDANLRPNLNFFAASRDRDDAISDPRVESLVLDKSSYLGFVMYQWRLFLSLWKFLRGQKGKTDYMYMPYHPSMIAPLLMSYLYGFRMTIRTGPVLPNLHTFKKDPNFLVYHGIRIVLGAFYRRASTIIVVTNKIKEWVCTTYKIPEWKCVVVPNAVNTRNFRPFLSERGDWGLPQNCVVAGFVGYIYEDQGLETVLLALAALKERKVSMPHFFVVGDGPDRRKLMSLAADLDVANNVTWAGKIPHDDVPKAINACDFMLAPFTKNTFRVSGSSAIKLFEYMACDKPILASRADDHLFIEENHLGLLVEPEDPIAWADAFQKLDPHWFSNISSGSDFVSQRHSFERLADKILKLSIYGPEKDMEGRDGA